MDCSTVNEKLSAYMDNELSPEERADVREHIKGCSQCSAELEELKKSVAHTRNIEEVEPPPWLTDKIMAQVREEAEQEKGRTWKRFFPFPVKIPIQAAATLAICVIAFFVIKSLEPEMKHTEMAQEEEGIALQKLAREVPAKKREGPGKAAGAVKEYESSPHAELPPDRNIMKEMSPESKGMGTAGSPALRSSPGDISSRDFMDDKDKWETFQAEIVEIRDRGREFVSYEVLFRRSDPEELFCNEVNEGHALFQVISGVREKLKSGQQKLDSFDAEQSARTLDLPKLRITAAQPYPGSCSIYTVSRDVIEWIAVEQTDESTPRKN